MRYGRISTQHFIPRSVPLTHIRKNVPNGMKHTEKKPLQKPKPCMKRYKGIKKKLTSRMPTNLTKTEIKGRDDRPFHQIISFIFINVKIRLPGSEFYCRTIRNHLCGTLHNSRRSVSNIHNDICTKRLSLCNHSFGSNCSCFVHHLIISS